MNSDFQKLFTGVLNAVKICLSKYFVSRGRASRAEFWYFFLFTFIVSVLFGAFRSGFSGGGGNFVSLVFLIPSIMVMIRRMHDQDKSGLIVFLSFIPFVGFVILLYMCAQKGTIGDNQFGPEADDIYGGVASGASYKGTESDQQPDGMDFNYEDIDYGDAQPPTQSTEPENKILSEEEIMKKYAKPSKRQAKSDDGVKRDRYGRVIKDDGSKDDAKDKSDFLKGN